MPNMRFAGTLSLVALALSAMPAYAGFEWVASPNDQTPPGAPAVSSVYVAPQPVETTRAPSNDYISPVIITGSPAPAAHAPRSAPAPVLTGEDVVPISSAPAPQTTASSAPLQITPEPVLSPAPAPVSRHSGRPDLATETIIMLSSANAPSPVLSPAAPPPASDGIVQGFGSQIPLTLALRQLLPVGYSFALDQDVDANTPVSFKGGKSWRETLSDTLSPASLVFHESDHAISISRAAAPTPAPALSASSPPPLPTPVNVKTAFTAFTTGAPQPALYSSSPTANGDWSAERGDTLRKVLGEWCQHANVELQWLAEYDYPIEASAHFSGSFEDAVRNILAGFDGARPQPIGELHSNPAAGQMVLVMTTRGNSYSN